MKDTILGLLLHEIYDRVNLAEFIREIPSIQVVLDQALANDMGARTLISTEHLENAFDGVSNIRKRKVEHSSFLTTEEKNILKDTIRIETENSLSFAKEVLNSHGLLGK